MSEQPPALAAWHLVVDTKDLSLLEKLLAEDVSFHSPAVFTPQLGKELTTAYLSAAMVVLGPTLRYRHEWWDASRAVLEFEAEVDGFTVHGIDMLTWDDHNLLTDFTVMVRPFRGLEKVIEAMARQLLGG